MFKAMIIGNLGQDAGLKQIEGQNGMTPVCGFTMAADAGRGNNKRTQWINCDIFGRRAQALHPYLTKGTKVFITGDVNVRTWIGKDGQTRIQVDVNVDEIELLGGGQERAQQQQNYAPSYPPPGTQPAPDPVYQAPPHMGGPPNHDKVPF